MSSFYDPYKENAFGKTLKGYGDGRNTQASTALELLWERTGSGMLGLTKSRGDFYDAGIDVKAMGRNAEFGANLFGKELDMFVDKAGAIGQSINASSIGQGKSLLGQRITKKQQALKQLRSAQGVDLSVGDIQGTYRDPFTGAYRNAYDSYTDDEIKNLTEENMVKFESLRDNLDSFKDQAYQALTGDDMSLADAYQSRLDAAYESFGGEEGFNEFRETVTQTQYNQSWNKEYGNQDKFSDLDAKYNAYNAVADFESEYMNMGSSYRIERDSSSADNFAQWNTAATEKGGRIEAEILANLVGEDGGSIISEFDGRGFDSVKVLNDFTDFYEDRRESLGSMSAEQIRVELKSRGEQAKEAAKRAKIAEAASVRRLRGEQDELAVTEREILRSIDEDKRLISGGLEQQYGQETMSRRPTVKGVSFNDGRPI